MTTITRDYFLRATSPSSSHSASAASYSGPVTSGAASSVQSAAFSKLARISRECANDGWDGYQAKAISRATCDRVRSFLNVLPSFMIAPDIVPESDGDIAIEWYVGPRRTFSISVGPSGPVHYAGLFGRDEEIHGVAPFVDSVPNTFLEHISGVLRGVDARRAT